MEGAAAEALGKAAVAGTASTAACELSTEVLPAASATCDGISRGICCSKGFGALFGSTMNSASVERPLCLACSTATAPSVVICCPLLTGDAGNRTRQ